MWYWKTNKFIIIVLVMALLIPPIFLGGTTPGAKGTSYESPAASVSELNIIYDLTYMKDDILVHEQNILDEQIGAIKQSEKFIVADIFLYNDYYNTEKYDFPESTQRFTNALIEQKRKYPDLAAYVITDPINNSYGEELNKQFVQLENNGIIVIVTDLNKVRDSNPLYAGYYKAYIKNFGQGDGGWIKNPFGNNGPDVEVRSYLKLLNFKANHRKVLITDKCAIVSSSNPHDGSSFHSNVAFKFAGEAVSYLLESEKAVAAFSGAEMDDVVYKYDASVVRKNTEVRILTEDKIKKNVLESIDSTEQGEEINLGMFYLADRQVIESLIDASNRDVEIKIILDSNKDAFGYEKNGIPNRQVAAELIEKSGNKIQVRWYLTHGEQYHTKIIGVFKDDESILIGGSANYTRRNLDNYNLESDLMVRLNNDDPLIQDFNLYFDKIWENKNGTYTVDYSEYEGNSLWKKIVYRIQESTGLSTF